MYGRNYGGKTLNFEASGGLTNASLVMQDRETDTYWSIMKGEALTGELKGEKLIELPIGEKMTWKDWRSKHPDTLVLSVNGLQDDVDGYAGYWKASKGFRDIEASDKRLKTKEPIFAFHYEGTAYAIRQKDLKNGLSVTLDGGIHVFLFREGRDKLHDSTTAYASAKGFEKNGKQWVEREGGQAFDKETRRFADLERLTGFDTFWYNWSLNNPETRLLKKQ